MSENVIIIVADDTFLPHAKHAMVNCLREGRWDGDFALIVPLETDVSDLEGRGITIIHVPATGFLTKFFVFSEWLHRWSTALYLDCDVIVQDDLGCLVQQLSDYEALEDGSQPIIADLEDTPAWMIFERAAHGLPSERHRTFMALVREYQCVLEQFWNTSILLFDPRSIPADTPGRLLEVQQKYQLINNQEEEGTDQQIIHCVLYDRIRKVKRKLFCFWGLDEPNARVPSDTRGWRGDEVPVLLHYARWHAPWIVKTPDMDAYRNRRLDCVCHEFYANNLQQFAQEFPKI